MATVVDTTAIKWLGPKVGGLLALFCIHKMNRVNSHKKFVKTMIINYKITKIYKQRMQSVNMYTEKRKLYQTVDFTFTVWSRSCCSLQQNDTIIYRPI